MSPMNPEPEVTQSRAAIGDIMQALKQSLRQTSAERAALGDVHSQFCLGDHFREGSGGSQDDAEALRWYRLAADRGYAPAECRVGEMYEAGRGGSRDIAEAVRWYSRAAGQGFASAQFRLGLIWTQEKATRRGSAIELEWCRWAAAPCEDEEALDWYTEAANQGSDNARSYLGVLWRKAADRGEAFAQCHLASMYERGWGVPEDKKAAELWYRKAANQGLAEAEYWLALAYLEDPIEQATWYRRAAEHGHAGAQSSLGSMYHEGRGVERDRSQAISWFRKAAEQGDWGAPAQLGLIYYSGEDGMRDLGRRQDGFVLRQSAATIRLKSVLGTCIATAKAFLGISLRRPPGIAGRQRTVIPRPKPSWHKRRLRLRPGAGSIALQACET
jgi:TPR repeat protein